MKQPPSHRNTESPAERRRAVTDASSLREPDVGSPAVETRVGQQRTAGNIEPWTARRLAIVASGQS